MTVPTQMMRQAPFCMVPLDLMFHAEVTRADLQVFAVLDFKCGKRGWWYGPIADICKTGQCMGDSTVRKSIDFLERAGYIQTRKLGKAHDFVLHFTILARNVPAPALDERTLRQKMSGPSARKIADPPPENERTLRQKMSGASKPQRETPKRNLIDLSSHRPLSADDAMDAFDVGDEREEIDEEETVGFDPPMHPNIPTSNDEREEIDEEQEDETDKAERLELADQKLQARQWWDHLAALQGASPLGAQVAQWHDAIKTMIAAEYTPQDFSDCWAAAKSTWSKPETVHMLAVYRNLDKLMPSVVAKRRKAEKAAVVRAAAPETKTILTDADRANAREIESGMQARLAKRREAQAFRQRQGIWTENHMPACACFGCKKAQKQHERDAARAIFATPPPA